MSNRTRSLHLQSKVSVMLVLLIAGFVAVSYTILRLIIEPTFHELENSASTSDFHRAEGALQTDIDNLDAVTADWAPWDDIYNYTSGSNPGFVKSNLNRPTLDNLGLDLMAILGADGQMLWAMVLLDGEEIAADSLNILNPADPASQHLVTHDNLSDKAVGIIQTVNGTMMISSRPILRSDDSGPIGGAIVLGQLIDSTHLDRLRTRTEVDLSLQPITADVPLEMGVVYSTTAESIEVSSILNDIYGEPIATLRTITPRSISDLGSRTVDAAMLLLIAAGALVCAFIWFMLRRLILQPIEELSTHIEEIRQSGDLSRQLLMQRNDELGLLASQFDNMTLQVHEARKALLDQSFKAGKADTAAEVMHNVRNAMTPMINGLERLKKSFKVSESLRVSESADHIADPECPPERKQKFLQYIVASFERIETVSGEALDDLHMVTAQAKQVEGILSDQERFANVAPVAEDIMVGELLGEAAHVIPQEDSQTVELSFDDTLKELRVSAHRIGLLQVMGNLILNAYESIKRNGESSGQISLIAQGELVEDKPMIRLTVRDNGGGFNKDISSKIFNRGFTSKTKGETTGLGLHWCANAVASMGGTIAAKSRGIGHGAEFHVVLPAPQGA